MIQWGITQGSHDAALAVFDDHNLLFASDAERFSRKKNDSIIPSTLIEYAEKKYGIPKKVYYYENPITKSLRRTWAGQKPKLVLPKFKYKLIYTNHHLSHAAYGYYTSPFDECTVVVIDAIGEWDTLTTWQAKDGELKRKGKHWKYPKSLGLFYSAMTQAAGWKPNEEEYIMMGASTVGKTTYNGRRQLRKLWDDNFNFHQGVTLNGLDQMEIAACTQSVYEGIIHEIFTNIRGNLVFVGGCALNVKANALLEHCNVYIPPSPGDAGSAIGCVLVRTKQKIDPTPYLGYEIGGKYPIEEIIKELKENQIVGVAKGRAEFGPRALGNRSLLADPSDLNIKDKVNKIKGREEFRPFAPMILKEDADNYFEEPFGMRSPYMNIVRISTYQTQKFYPGIVHIDGTSRIQIVENGVHRELLEAWKEETGCPMLLNTSLNIKGEPIVNDEFDVKKFENQTGVKVL
jgi:carbamoyltransferase